MSAFLFGAWSTIETSTFAANALGCAFDEAMFSSLMTSAVREVDPRQVLPPNKNNHRSKHGAFVKTLPDYTQAMVGAAEVVSELHEQHVASKHRYSSMTGWASSASGSPPPETLTLTPLSSVSLRARPRELDRRAVFDQMSPIPLPANAVAFSEPSIPLGRSSTSGGSSSPVC